MKLKDEALRYTEHGIPVFPLHWIKKDGNCSCRLGAMCQAKGKHPRIKNWGEEATTDPEKIEDWWSHAPMANIGIPMGEKSGLVALDVDTRHDGEKSLADLVSEFGDLPDTITATTGSGGKHYIFKYTEELCLKNVVGFRDGLDVRTQGGLIVAAPSMHASGNPYHLIVKDVLTKHPGICSYDDIVRCAKEGSMLFADEGQLTWEKSGRFWSELILVLPCYHEDALAVFGKRVRMGYGNPDSDAKVKALEKLLQALFPMYTLFINHFDEEAAADNQKHREMFESHWEFFAGTNVQPPVRDKDITEDDFSPYLRMLLSRFPEFFEQEEHEQFKEYYWGAIQDLLCACYNDNPELAVKMWRSMYEYPFTYNNPAAHEFLDAMMENLVESDNPVALLDIIARDDSLKRLIFCSEENDNLRQKPCALCTLAEHMYRKIILKLLST